MTTDWPWKDRTEGPSLEALTEAYRYLREIGLKRGLLVEDANGRLRRVMPGGLGQTEPLLVAAEIREEV